MTMVMMMVMIMIMMMNWHDDVDIMIYLSIHPSVRLSVRPSIHPSVRPSVRPSIHSSIPFIRPLYRSFIKSSCLPSSLRVNRPICGKSANLSIHITPAVCRRASATWSCLINLGLCDDFLPVFLSIRAIRLCDAKNVYWEVTNP